MHPSTDTCDALTFRWSQFWKEKALEEKLINIFAPCHDMYVCRHLHLSKDQTKKKKFFRSQIGVCTKVAVTKFCAPQRAGGTERIQRTWDLVRLGPYHVELEDSESKVCPLFFFIWIDDLSPSICFILPGIFSGWISLAW